MPAILQLLPWGLQELLSPFPLRGCPAPPVTLCTPGSHSSGPPCALQAPLTGLSRFLPALLPAGISCTDSSSGPELSIRKEGETHHLVTSTRSIQLLKR